MQRAALLTVDSCISSRGVGRGGGWKSTPLSFVSNLSIYLCIYLSCVSVAVSVSVAHCVMKIFIFPSSAGECRKFEQPALTSSPPALSNPLHAVRSAKCMCVCVVCVLCTTLVKLMRFRVLISDRSTAIRIATTK